MTANVTRPIRIDGTVAYVPLTQGYVALIDAEDVRLIDQWDWTAEVGEKTVYAKRNTRVDGKSHTIYLHSMFLAPRPGFQVDHANLNGLDNRRINIRYATRGQNQHNQGVRKSNTSGFKGVSWDSQRKKWYAKIRLDRKQIPLGRFDTLDEANAARRAATIRLHGVFGRVS